ncbi:hypothetical protein [Clostridium ihumii]|uniref:hypothetical protein n=1 Tax=Clostridium ihumii TaxID=1470356 RepID=UPI0013154630|nr:hypothetical protein [Clostridium ihumii]
MMYKSIYYNENIDEMVVKIGILKEKCLIGQIPSTYTITSEIIKVSLVIFI